MASIANKPMLKSKYIITVYFIVSLVVPIFSQHEISKFEYRWAFFHPFAAKSVQHHLKEAMDVYHLVKKSNDLDSFESGGTLDAFRHAYTMAYLSRFVNVNKLRELGKAHEKGNEYYFYKNRQEFGERADSLACVMDLRNNELGFEIGEKHKNSSKDDLKNIIIDQIKVGNAWKLKRNSQNHYVSCQNEVILIENYRAKWFMPKCLVKSND
jgi:hypothetical protein